MNTLPRWVVLLSGWPRRLVAFLVGAIGALAMAPVNSVVALVIPMTFAVWFIDGSARGEPAGRFGRMFQWRSCRAAAGVGWWWGFGYFIAGLWWLGAAFLVEPEKDAWALPFGLLGVPAGLALFPALGFGLSRLLWSSGPARILALAAGLGVSEWLRGSVFTGFPWNNYGMALAGNLQLAQAASLVGNAGLTLLAVLICAAPATLAGAGPGSGANRIRLWGPTALALIVAVGLFGFGWDRLRVQADATVPGVHLRILQPNVQQDANFSYANKDKIVADYLALSAQKTTSDGPGLQGVTHLIWPESAFPFILARDPDALEAISKALPPNVTLVTGAARMEIAAEGSATPASPLYYNSVQVVGPGGALLGAYDKVHLVPFGEYLPFDQTLRSLGLTHFVHIPGGFTPGARRRILDVPGLPPVAPIICYEAIFSGSVVPESLPGEAEKPGLLLNVTNDGWFGPTSGPYQHLAQARLRAIEQGLPLIRAANTGISAIIDPYGRMIGSLPLDTMGVLDGNLPQRIRPTIFARYHTVIVPLLYLLLLLSAWIFSRLRTGR